jgi:hypothetical protein
MWPKERGQLGKAKNAYLNFPQIAVWEQRAQQSTTVQHEAVPELQAGNPAKQGASLQEPTAVLHRAPAWLGRFQKGYYYHGIVVALVAWMTSWHETRGLPELCSNTKGFQLSFLCETNRAPLLLLETVNHLHSSDIACAKNIIAVIFSAARIRLTMLRCSGSSNGLSSLLMHSLSHGCRC